MPRAHIHYWCCCCWERAFFWPRPIVHRHNDLIPIDIIIYAARIIYSQRRAIRRCTYYFNSASQMPPSWMQKMPGCDWVELIISLFLTGLDCITTPSGVNAAAAIWNLNEGKELGVKSVFLCCKWDRRRFYTQFWIFKSFCRLVEIWIFILSKC